MRMAADPGLAIRGPASGFSNPLGKPCPRPNAAWADPALGFASCRVVDVSRRILAISTPPEPTASGTHLAVPIRSWALRHGDRRYGVPPSHLLPALQRFHEAIASPTPDLSSWPCVGSLSEVPGLLK